MQYAPALFHNAALIIVLCFTQRLIVARWPGAIGTVLSGTLFGGAAIMAMSTAVVLPDGLIFDSRTIVLSVGALFGGPVVAGISGGLAAAYRVHLGGSGAWVGVCVIAIASLAGLLVRHRYSGNLLSIQALQFVLLGLAVHIPAILLFMLLPVDFVEVILVQLAVPYVGILTLGTLVMGLLLREIEALQLFDSVVAEGRKRLQNMFDSTATALIEENLSDVYATLQRLREAGVKDLRAHLHRHPQQIVEMSAQVEILQANKAAVRLFRVASERELKARIDTFFGPGAQETFVDELCAIWDGAEWFQQETMFQTGDGTELLTVIAVPIPPDEDRARHVPVSILDITALRQSERQVLRERERLREVLWGTHVGTWEWNVQTGETTFDERWAEIVGYTLADLAPVSIATWEHLTHPDDLQRSKGILAEVFDHKRDFYECEVRMRHRDGSWVWILDRGTVVQWGPDGSPRRMSGTHMDVTTRKRAEERANRLSSVRATLLLCHANILATQGEIELFERTVATLVETRGYSLVWVGVPEDGPDKVVRPIARAGDQASFVDETPVHWSDDGLGQGPTGRAIRTGEIQVARNLTLEDGFDPWLASATNHALVASVAAPIKADGEVFATLTIYSSIPDVFDEEEVGLIGDFAHSIGLAVRTRRLRAEQSRLHSELEHAAFGAVHALAATIEKRDPYTAGHQESVAALSVAIGEKLGWSEFKLQGLRLGATIHDIGKIYVPAEILNRPGKLTDPEFAIIKTHPQIGFEILESASFPWPIKDMVVQHHERLDGSGYPKGLHGDQITEEAKVIGVADVVDAITAHRPYRPGLGIETALSEISLGRGTIYDPLVVDACIALFREDGYRLQRG